MHRAGPLIIISINTGINSTEVVKTVQSGERERGRERDRVRERETESERDRE